MIGIVDFGMGNLASIANMFKKTGTQTLVTADPGALAESEKLILPGVGAFAAGMKNLEERKLIEPLNRAVLERKVPIMGLCLGMQLMTHRSEEGGAAGLGWIDAETVRFRFDPAAGMKVPHMGWNTVHFERPTPLAMGLGDDARFYFVHSFHVVCRNERDVLGQTVYGYGFASTLSNENIYGVQFHPEKSHRFGMQLLRNFAHLESAS